MVVDEDYNYNSELNQKRDLYKMFHSQVSQECVLVYELRHALWLDQEQYLRQAIMQGTLQGYYQQILVLITSALNGLGEVKNNTKKVNNPRFNKIIEDLKKYFLRISERVAIELQRLNELPKGLELTKDNYKFKIETVIRSFNQFQNNVLGELPRKVCFVALALYERPLDEQYCQWPMPEEMWLGLKQENKSNAA
ncbi:MAG: hypothetical protein Q8Q35_04510 [Nanoarchaeota archaeon]|nr:hypothetical protein [Nanoarchaeota archaeon]